MAETGFAERLAEADVCLTGEGSVDRQTALGKTAARVVEASAAAGVPCFVVGGAVDDGADEALYALGAGAVVAAGRRPQSLDDALAGAAGDLRATARALCGAFLAGRRAAAGGAWEGSCASPR
jgi:glycerate kinase